MMQIRFKEVFQSPDGQEYVLKVQKLIYFTNFVKYGLYFSIDISALIDGLCRIRPNKLLRMANFNYAIL